MNECAVCLKFKIKRRSKYKCLFQTFICSKTNHQLSKFDGLIVSNKIKAY